MKKDFCILILIYRAFHVLSGTPFSFTGLVIDIIMALVFAGLVSMIRPKKKKQDDQIS